MKKASFFAVVCVCVFAAFAAPGKKSGQGGKTMSVQAQSKARIAEIASFLPEDPAAPGARITNRKVWEKLAELESAEKIVRKAEALLRQTVPECPDEMYLEYSKTGNRRDYQIPYAARIGNAQTLATAECLENKGRFIPKLSEYLEAICAERSWMMPAHDKGLRTFDGKEFGVDLGASARANACAWIVSTLRGSISGVLSFKVKKEIERRVFSTYRSCWNRKSGFAPLGWFAGPANWTAVCHCGVVCAALAVIEDRADRAAFVETAERFLPFYIAGFPPDGYCSEGMGYWNYGWGHYLQVALAVKQATGGKVDFFADPKTRTIMSFGTGCQMVEGHAPDFADGGGAVSDAVLLLGRLQWPELPVNSSTLDRDLLFGGPAVFSLRAFGQLDGVPDGRTDSLPPRSIYPFGQVWVFRSGTQSELAPFAVGMKGGHNAEFHNHNDVGSYAVRFGNVLISGDPGGTEYTAKTFSAQRYTIPLLASYGHPVPVLNGCYQQQGREYAAKILSTDFSDASERVVMDIAGAYPDKAKVKSVVRKFEYDRKSRTFSVADSVTFKLKGTYSVPVLTPGLMKPCKEEGKYAITVSSGDEVRECDVSISVAGAGWKLSEGKRIDNPNRTAPMRYGVMLDAPVKTVEVKVMFAPRDVVVGKAIAAEAPPPDAAEEEVAEKEGPVLFDEAAGVKAALVYAGFEERVYAREIQWYLGEMTEETFRLSDKEPESGPAVVIRIEPDEARVRTAKDRVLITGNGKGLSRAVSHFLEELGVRYLHPADYGRVIPWKSKVTYPDSDWRMPPSQAASAEIERMDRKEIIRLLKASSPILRDYYAWHGVDASGMPAPTADGWELYSKVKGVDSSDAAAVEALLVDFRRSAYGPAARIMNEYFREIAKPSPDSAKLAEILDRAVVETANEASIFARIRAISESIR